MLLQWLPEATSILTPEQHRGMFIAGTWPRQMADTLDTLLGENWSQDDCDIIIEYADDPTVAGSIVRHVLVCRASWPEEIVTRVIEMAKSIEGNQPDKASQLSWLEMARVDQDTRERFTKQVASLQDPKSLEKVFFLTLPVIHPFQVGDPADLLIAKAYSAGQLWRHLDRLIDADPKQAIHVLANAKEPASTAVQSVPLQKDASRKLDASIAGILLRKDHVLSASFLVVAQRHGDWATARLLESKEDLLVGVGNWTPDQVRSTIQAIHSRKNATKEHESE